LQFVAAAQFSTVNCDERDRDRSRQCANKLLRLSRIYWALLKLLVIFGVQHQEETGCKQWRVVGALEGWV